MIQFEMLKVNGFKSLLDTSISLNKQNILIGPNGSGKTNFLEFFIFLQKIISPSMSPSYPFARWGGFQNIGHNLNPEQTIDIEFTGKVDDQKFHYTAKVNNNNEAINFLFESLDVSNVCNIKREHQHIVMKYPQELIAKLKNIKNFSLSPDEMEMMRFLEEKGYQEMQIEPSNSILNIPGNSHYSFNNEITYGIIHKKMATVSYVVNRDNFNQSLLETILDSLRFSSVFSIKSICGVRTPSYYGFEALQEDGKGLINLLHNVFKRNNNRFPQNIENAMHALFPGWELGFDISQEGKITLFGKYENKIFVPSNLPDGLLKLLFILTTLHMNPRILLIDEIENSLHYNIIRYVLDECKNHENTTVIMTTHSPLVMDISDIKDVIITENTGISSRYSHIDNDEELTKKLIKNNMKLSDEFFDGTL